MFDVEQFLGICHPCPQVRVFCKGCPGGDLVVFLLVDATKIVETRKKSVQKRQKWHTNLKEKVKYLQYSAEHWLDSEGPKSVFVAILTQVTFSLVRFAN